MKKVYSKEDLYKTITTELEKGLKEIENFNNNNLITLQTEINYRDKQIQQLNGELLSLKDHIKFLEKINLNLVKKRKSLLKELDIKNKKLDFIEGITILRCGNGTSIEEAKIIRQLLEIFIEEEDIEEYIGEFVQIISDSILNREYTIVKKEINKNYAIYHDHFLKAPSRYIRVLLFAYHSKKMHEAMKHLLNSIVISGKLASYDDEDAMNIIIYIIYYKQFEICLKNKKFKMYLNENRGDNSIQLLKYYDQYHKKKNIAFFEQFVAILKVNQQSIDIFKIEMIKIVLKKFFKKEEIEIYYTINNRLSETIPKTYQYRHPNHSELRNFGYQITNRTDDQRWAALKDYMAVYGLQATAEELHKRIRLKLNREEDRKKYINAIRKWQSDLERLKEEYFENDFPWPTEKLK